jgi:hypothetical protein
VGSSAQP